MPVNVHHLSQSRDKQNFLGRDARQAYAEPFKTIGISAVASAALLAQKGTPIVVKAHALPAILSEASVLGR